MGVACRSIVDRLQPLLDARIASLRILLLLAILRVLGCGATSLLSFQCFTHTHRLESSSQSRFLDPVHVRPVLERFSLSSVLDAALPAGRSVTALQVIQPNVNLSSTGALASKLALACRRDLAYHRQHTVLFACA